MTANDKRIVTKLGLRIAFYCVWSLFVLQLTTRCYIAMIDWAKHDEQVRLWLTHARISPIVGYSGLALIWLVVTVILLWLPIMILKRKARVTHDAA